MVETATKPTLLIVDDDPLITDTLAYALGKDFEVLPSDSRSHAVSLLRQLALFLLLLPFTPTLGLGLEDGIKYGHRVSEQLGLGLGLAQTQCGPIAEQAEQRKPVQCSRF